MARIQRFADLTTLPLVLNEAHKSRTSRLEQVVSFGQKTLGKTFYTAKQREEREESNGRHLYRRLQLNMDMRQKKNIFL